MKKRVLTYIVAFMLASCIMAVEFVICFLTGWLLEIPTNFNTFASILAAVILTQQTVTLSFGIDVQEDK